MPRDQPDWPFSTVADHQPLDLSNRQTQSVGGTSWFQIAVDNRLNALESIKFLHRKVHPGFACHGQSPVLDTERMKTEPDTHRRHFYLAESGHFYLGITLELRIMYIMLN